MAKKPVAPAVATGVEVVEDLHAVVAEDGVEFTDVTGKDDLPPGVTDEEDEPEKKPAAKPAAKPVAKAAEDEVPEEFKGKSLGQVIKMYKDAQGLIGRQGSELGSLRTAADKYIAAHLTRAASPAAPAAPAAKPAVKPFDDVEFFANPKAAIEQLIAEHPLLKDLQGTAKTHQEREVIRGRQEAKRAFDEAHPDATEILASETFRDWVVKSPNRQQMLLRAHKQFDFGAANDLFDTFKELQAAKVPPVVADQKPAAKSTGKPVADAAAARVPTGGNASPSSGGGGPKIYRRADIIRLMQDDPARYELMGDEITKAYAEGRVR